MTSNNKTVSLQKALSGQLNICQINWYVYLFKINCFNSHVVIGLKLSPTSELIVKWRNPLEILTFTRLCNLENLRLCNLQITVALMQFKTKHQRFSHFLRVAHEEINNVENYSLCWRQISHEIFEMPSWLKIFDGDSFIIVLKATLGLIYLPVLDLYLLRARELRQDWSPIGFNSIFWAMIIPLASVNLTRP